jgi:hypothetical protein
MIGGASCYLLMDGKNNCISRGIAIFFLKLTGHSHLVALLGWKSVRPGDLDYYI